MFVAGFIAYAGILSMTGRSAKVVRVIGGGSAYLFLLHFLYRHCFGAQISQANFVTWLKPTTYTSSTFLSATHYPLFQER